MFFTAGYKNKTFLNFIYNILLVSIFIMEPKKKH